MSDNDNNESTETAVEAKAPPRASKASVMSADVAPLVDGIESFDKSAFRVYGQQRGVRLALPLTQKISRTFFYGEPVPEHPAIVKYTEQERKDQRLGGITARVDFDQGPAAAIEAIGLLAEAVRKAPAPEAKPKAASKKAKTDAPPPEADAGEEEQPQA